jgi:hypothetical protein
MVLWAEDLIMMYLSSTAIPALKLRAIPKEFYGSRTAGREMDILSDSIENEDGERVLARERTVRLRKGDRVVGVDLRGSGPLAATVSESQRAARATVTSSINAQSAKNARTLVERASYMGTPFNFQ